MKKTLLFFAIVLSCYRTVAQSLYQPYSYQFYQKLNAESYGLDSLQHTSIKPFILNGALKLRVDTLLGIGLAVFGRSWLHRKIFDEHLIQVDKPDFTFYADYLPDHGIGRDVGGKKNVWINSRGFQAALTIGTQFSFYTSLYENQAVFTDYLNTYINQIGIVSGQAYDHSEGKNVKDWSYVTALMSYTPIKYLNIAIGQDKTFIGDGYRSMLLSDFAAPYPMLKLTANVGRIKYMTMWSYMDDPSATKFDTFGNQRRKWGVFQYLDWNVSRRVSLGLFQSVIWADADDAGHKRGFDFKYISPVIFLRNVQAASGSPDNSMLGFTGKYKLTNKLAMYGQFAFDEFQAKDFFSGNGSSRNKYGYQIGIRGSDLGNVKTLNYLIEYNGAKPYTYSQLAAINNYAEQNEPLAHPFGANFREIVGLLNFSHKRFDFSGELSLSKYGLDGDEKNNGKDIFKIYQTAYKYYAGNYTGQGLFTKMYYAEAKVAYILNPKYNLRVELSGLYRNEKNDLFNDRSSTFTIGLRSSFRNLYTDIASYKIH